jgi:hypothetical protein
VYDRDVTDDERAKATLDYEARGARRRTRDPRPFVVAVKLGISVILLSVVGWLTYSSVALGWRPWGLGALSLTLATWMVWTSARELFGSDPG